jgi:hypothetical protein
MGEVWYCPQTDNLAVLCTDDHDEHVIDYFGCLLIGDGWVFIGEL